jgi:hypothetical protein
LPELPLEFVPLDPPLSLLELHAATIAAKKRTLTIFMGRKPPLRTEDAARADV